MGAAPRVSVLIPCFRSARFVRKALESVASQTLEDWEVVLVDNASDDETFSIAQEYSRRDPRVRVFKNSENIGPVRNWRRCAELARGTYAGLLFSDDWYEPSFLSEAAQLLDGLPAAGFVYSSVSVVTSGGGPTKVSYRLEGAGAHPSREFLTATYERRGPSVPLSPCCALMRRPDLERWLTRSFANEDRLGYLRHGAGPDVAVYVQACVEYPEFGHIPEPRVNFLAHESNLSWRPEVKLAYASALRELFEAFPMDQWLDADRVGAVFAGRFLSSRDRWRALGALGPRGWTQFMALLGRALARRLGLLARG